jgi:hypothetical protein
MREHESRAGHVTLVHDVDIRREAFFVEAQRVEYAPVFVGKGVRCESFARSGLLPSILYRPAT